MTPEVFKAWQDAGEVNGMFGAPVDEPWMFDPTRAVQEFENVTYVFNPQGVKRQHLCPTRTSRRQGRGCGREVHRCQAAEFDDSSTQKPGQTFPCDIKRALELVKQLQAAGMTCKAIYVDGMKDRFPTYHKSVTGPDASVRPVFGFKGALVEDFVRTTVPALLIFEGDRYP